MDSASYGSWWRSSLTAGLPVLWLGDSASGKTSLVRTTALELRVKSCVELAALNCNPHIKASDVQAALEAALVNLGTGHGFSYMLLSLPKQRKPFRSHPTQAPPVNACG